MSHPKFAADQQTKSALTVSVTSANGGKNIEIGGLIPGADYSLALFSCHNGAAYPAVYELNGKTYASNASAFAFRDTALCTGVTADAQGRISGMATVTGDAAGSAYVLTGLQITGDIPEAPKGMIIIIR